MFVMTWWREADPGARRAFVAASAGWMLDSFDVMLYALVLPALMASLEFDAATAGRIQSFTLVAAAVGGIVFGIVADRVGRTRALSASVLVYSLFTAACGLATSAAMLAAFRVGLGFGMGGEWASGAALVSDTWPERHRSKALAFMQSTWAVGYALAALVSWGVQGLLGLDWRTVFFVGVLPALLTFYVRSRVPEPDRWRTARASAARVSARRAIGGPMLATTVALTLMNACTLFGYWGFNTFVPSYLVAAPAQGGAGLHQDLMSALVVANQCGTWLGYVTFGYISDIVGRKTAYVWYLLLAGALVWSYSAVRQPTVLLLLGPVASFFSTGYFSGFGIVTSELYPTPVRATAQGLTYNTGRLASAGAPWIVGGLAQSHGYPTALSLAAAAFFVAAAFWSVLPETRGRTLTEG
jgi:MFS family permease